MTPLFPICSNCSINGQEHCLKKYIKTKIMTLHFFTCSNCGINRQTPGGFLHHHPLGLIDAAAPVLLSWRLSLLFERWRREIRPRTRPRARQVSGSGRLGWSAPAQLGQTGRGSAPGKGGVPFVTTGKDGQQFCPPPGVLAARCLHEGNTVRTGEGQRVRMTGDLLGSSYFQYLRHIHRTLRYRIRLQGKSF